MPNEVDEVLTTAGKELKADFTKAMDTRAEKSTIAGFVEQVMGNGKIEAMSNLLQNKEFRDGNPELFDSVLKACLENANKSAQHKAAAKALFTAKARDLHDPTKLAAYVNENNLLVVAAQSHDVDIIKSVASVEGVDLNAASQSILATDQSKIKSGENTSNPAILIISEIAVEQKEKQKPREAAAIAAGSNTQSPTNLTVGNDGSVTLSNEDEEKKRNHPPMAIHNNGNVMVNGKAADPKDPAVHQALQGASKTLDNALKFPREGGVKVFVNGKEMTGELPPEVKAAIENALKAVNQCLGQYQGLSQQQQPLQQRQEDAQQQPQQMPQPTQQQQQPTTTQPLQQQPVTNPTSQQQTRSQQYPKPRLPSPGPQSPELTQQLKKVAEDVLQQQPVQSPQQQLKRRHSFNGVPSYAEGVKDVLQRSQSSIQTSLTPPLARSKSMPDLHKGGQGRG